MGQIEKRLNTAKCQWKSDDGASAVEFAIVLPLLMLLLFGMIEFGLIIYNKQVITNASREGARYAIVQPICTPSCVPVGSPFPYATVSPPPPICHNECNVQKVVQDYCKDNLISFGIQPLPTIIVTGGTASPTTYTNICVPTPSPTPPADIEVQVSYSYNFLVYQNIVTLFGGSQGSSLQLSSSTTMRCEDQY